MRYHNVHTHVFTSDNAPEKFLRMYLPDAVADAVERITNTQAGEEVVRRMLERFGGNGGRRYADFLRIGKSKNQGEVFEALLASCPDNVCFTALTMNMDHLGHTPSKSLFGGQLEGILEVKKRYPDNLLVFFGLDPRWKANGTEIRKAVEAHFETKLPVNEIRSVYPYVGLKIYPSLGFYAFDQRLKETYEWAADNGVPVLSHCNYLGGIFNNDRKAVEQALSGWDPYANAPCSNPFIQERKWGAWLMGTNASRNNKISCSYFLEPESYRTLFDYFDKRQKKLKLCLAHFGGDGQINAGRGKSKDAQQLKPYGKAGTNWFNTIQGLMKQYEGVYTDISYAVAVEKADLFSVFRDEANNPGYGDRVMFGTDYYMTEQEDPHDTIYSRFKTYAVQAPLPNYGNSSLWDAVANKNVEKFLQSKYYPDKVE